METKSQEHSLGGGDDSQDIQEHLEPEQELFLSRIAELQQLNLSSNEAEQTTTGIMSARINFGLPVHQVSSQLPEKQIKEKSRPNDKGFSGILAPKSKTTNRSVRSSTPKLSSEENNENISNNTPKTSAMSKKENSLTTSTNLFTVPNLSSTKSASNSPLMSTKVPKNEEKKIHEVPNIKSSNSNPSMFTIPTLGGLSNSKTMPNLGGLSSGPTPAIPSLGGLAKQDSNPSKFTIPNLGGLGGSKPTTFTIPSLGGLADNKSKSGSFTIPSLGGLANANSNNAASKPLSLGGLAANKTNTEPFTIPSLGGLKDNKTSTFTIPSLGGLAGDKAEPGAFNIPKLGGLTESKPSAFAIPSLQGLNISSTTTPSTSSLSSLANMHLSVQQTISPSNDVKPEHLEDKSSEEIETPTEEIIDLMAALRSDKDPKYSPEKIEENMAIKTQQTKLLITDLRKIKTMLLKKSSSSIGKVISTRWQWKTEREKVTLPTLFTEADRFSFATPSPDDIVMKAQSQSRSFLNTTARQTKAGSPRL